MTAWTPVAGAVLVEAVLVAVEPPVEVPVLVAVLVVLLQPVSAMQATAANTNDLDVFFAIVI
jgi:type III secretory pathway component EscS